MTKPKTSEELALMRQSGKISAQALKKALEAAKPGVTLLEIEKVAASEIKKSGGELSFATVPGYKWATCLTVNEELVHGIPRDIVLKNGDILSIDVGAVFKGWHTDTAWSVIIGEIDKSVKSVSEAPASAVELKEKKRFLAVGEEALWKGISQAIDGNAIGDISNAIQTAVERAGFDISRTLIGHGVGRQLHEEPEVPGYGQKGIGLILQAGMTLAIEVIYAKGKAEVVLAEDSWTYINKDGSWGGLFEMSIIVGKERAEVITDWRKV